MKLESETEENMDSNFTINKVKSNKSVIMEENEFPLIHLGIQTRYNQKVKELKKLFQASIDGYTAKDFHLRCDNIPNILVLVKTVGNRRFGGFTSSYWSSPDEGIWNFEPKTFLFSLDKKKIYPFEGKSAAVYNKKESGPWFGMNGFFIQPNPKDEKNLYTYESNPKEEFFTFNYNGDNNALSEDGKNEGIFAVEYEVFQVIYE